MISPEELASAILTAQRSLEELRRLSEGFIRARVTRRYRLDPGETDVLLDKVYGKIVSALYEYNVGKPKRTFAWFMTVVDHAVIDQLRAGKFRLESVDRVLEPTDESVPTSDVAEEKKRIYAALRDALSRVQSPKRREMLMHIALRGNLDAEDLARTMNLPSVEAARQLKYHALLEIRRILAGLGCGPEDIALLFK
jgi:DNA-directed RNA polymerase specialized sigma24 family protein